MRSLQKKSKKHLWIALIISIIGIPAILWAMFGVKEISFSELQAREQISQRIPIEATKGFLGYEFNIKIDDIEIDFLEGDLIGAMAKGSIESKGGSVDIEISAVGHPELRGNAFYFKPDEFNFDKFDLSGLAKQNSKKAGKLVSATVKKFAGDIFKEADIKIDSKAISEKIQDGIKSFAEGIIVGYLNKNPVRKLEGGKERFAALAIKDIGVDGDSITIHLSILRLATHILVYVLIFILSIGAALTMPWWGVGLMAFS